MSNGATALIKTLVDSGIEVCFTNPGTSEMHFVAALDSEPAMRAVLALFEGVATGAADGYARMAGKPAATLLHLGCGLGNGLANLHNARKGKVPVVNVVGDHATTHVQYDAQLQSDIETVARNVSPGFVRTSQTTAELPGDAADAITAARSKPNQVATLILPADVSWGQGAEATQAEPPPAAPVADETVLDEVATALKAGKKTALLLGRQATLKPGLMAATKLAAASGAKLFVETFPTRLTRGAGLPPVEKIAYLAEMATSQLAPYRHLVLVDAKAPVSFFAYPGKPSYLVPKKCEVHTLASPDMDAVASLEALVKHMGANAAEPALQQAVRPPRPEDGTLTAEKVCQAIGHLLPDNAILVDESNTSGLMLGAMTAGCPAHDLLALTGGAIGQGLPNAVGAAIACPDRPVIAVIGDGTAMYTIQALWTMAREGLNVTAIICSNAAYSVLNLELDRVGAEASGVGDKAASQLDLSHPPIDFARLGEGMGVPGTTCENSDAFCAALEKALATPGPQLIDARIPESLDARKRRMLPLALRALPKLPQPVARALKRKIAP